MSAVDIGQWAVLLFLSYRVGVLDGLRRLAKRDRPVRGESDLSWVKDLPQKDRADLHFQTQPKPLGDDEFRRRINEDLYPETKDAIT